jgi:hypothetical protein
MRVLLSQLEYPAKNHKLIGVPDPLIVGPAARVHEDDEDPARFFPSLDRWPQVASAGDAASGPILRRDLEVE